MQLDPQKIRYLVVHCSDTEADLTATDIHAMHLGFGWDGIGYHAVITKDGTLEPGRPHFGSARMSMNIMKKASASV